MVAVVRAVAPSWSLAEVAQYVRLGSGKIPDERLVASLYAATAGNPLFVDGVVRMLIAEPDASHDPGANQFKIPDTVREAIGPRLAVLSDRANSLLKVGATIGNEFEVDVCAQAGGVSRGEFNSLLAEVSADGIVKPLGQSSYRFAHALIRDAVYNALDVNTRIRHHGRIAEAIERIHAKDLSPYAAELAQHFRETDASEKAIDYSCRAAEAASEVSQGSRRSLIILVTMCLRRSAGTSIWARSIAASSIPMRW